MMTRDERGVVEDAVRADARKLCISNDTVGWFLESATPRQLDAVAGMLSHEIAVRERNKRARLASPAVEKSLAATVGEVDYSREQRYYEAICNGLAGGENAPFTFGSA